MIKSKENPKLKVKKAIKKIKKLFYLKPLFLLFFCPFAVALTPKGPLTLAFSGSGRAVTKKGAEYHLLNPASIVHAQTLHGQGFYGFKTKESKAFWGVSIMENSSFPISFSYIRERESGDQYMSLGTAGLLLPGFSLGVNVSRWEIDKDTNWNLQAGLLIKPPRSPFSLGFTYGPILPLEGAYKGERKWGLGLAFEPYKWLSLRADTLYNPDKKWSVAGGGMFTVAQFLVFRLSSQWQFTDEVFLLAGGVGVFAKHFGLDYGLSQQKTKEILHTLNVHGSF